MRIRLCFHDPTKLDSEQNLGQTMYDLLKFIGQPTTEMTNLKIIGVIGGLCC